MKPWVHLMSGVLTLLSPPPLPLLPCAAQVLYELLSRCLLIFSELPTSTSDPAITEQ
jgi:hypothetical protein